VRRYKRRAGEKFSGWRLTQPLGSGGNAEVWKAVGSDGREAALKILHSKNPDGEPFRRFRAEVNILRGLGDREGLLPIIEANLDADGQKSLPWLAMPVATPLRESLGESPSVETVAGAVTNIATSLAGLHAEGVSHRDIKPDNLYLYKGRWSVGDFGLASYPEKEALTEEGRKLGPQYYLAPEMLLNPATADGPPADVYSIAKTLWVLATGQNYPPPGQYRVEIPALTLSAYVTHPRVQLLDRLLERATAYTPGERPTMREMADELSAWLSPPAGGASMEDMTDLYARIFARTEPKRRAEEEQRRLLDEFYGRQEAFLQECVPLANHIATTLQSRDVIIRRYSELLDVLEAYREKEENRIGGYFGGEGALQSDAITIQAHVAGSDHVQLICGFGSRLFEDGKVTLEAAHFVRLRCQEGACPPGMIWSSMHHAAHDLVWSRSEITCLGSAHEAQTRAELLAGLTTNLRTALGRFASLLES
jgi:serine/threonine protein kinase